MHSYNLIKEPILSILLSIFFINTLYASDVSLNRALYRVTYENVKFPQGEDMGFVGVNYLFKDELGLYYGLGVYGSMRGERGGFFTGGLELGYEHYLYKNLFVDVGTFIGGGGGGSAPQGGGLMLRPHGGVGYDAKNYRVGLSYSLVEFPNGDISSNQLSLQFDIPLKSVSTSGASDSKSIYRALKSYAKNSNFGWVDHYFAATFQQYYPLSGVKDTSGFKDEGTISLIGFEYGNYFNERWFNFLETAGAFRGGAGGYAEVAGGLGYNYRLNRRLGLKAKAAIGSAGGGEVDTGGGFIYKASIGAYYKPIEQLTVDLQGGYIDAPNGTFEAQSAKLSLAYNLTFLGVGRNIRHVDAYKKSSVGEWNVRVLNQSYLSSETIRYNRVSDPVQLIGLKIDRYINRNFYVTGQALGAYDGDVGGYASGLLGVGYKTPYFFNMVSFYAELGAGAGGGGGVDSEGGAIFQPMAGVNFALTNTLDFQVGMGKIESHKGRLDTAVLDFGFVYKFNTIERRFLDAIN